MRLLAATDFALRILMRLAAEPERRLSTGVLAQELGLSRHHLHKLVQDLAAMGLLETARGAGGGARLALPPERIGVAAVIRRMERGQVLVECFRPDGGNCTLQPCCGLRGAIASAERAFYAALEGVSLATCLAPFNPPSAPR